jgi:hypothetical protein
MENCNLLDKLRKPKIFSMALFDWLIFIIICGAIAYFMNKNFLLLILFGIIFVVILHKILRIPTMLNYYLGFNDYASVINNRKTC